MEEKHQGQCLCGAVRYEFSGPVKSSFLCHCRDCQLSGGSQFHHGLMIDEAGFSQHGETISYKSQGGSGRFITREFCGVCGSGLFNRLEAAPGMLVIKAGTLDDPSAVPPQSALFADNQASWLSYEDLKSFPTMPGRK